MFSDADKIKPGRETEVKTNLNQYSFSFLQQANITLPFPAAVFVHSVTDLVLLSCTVVETRCHSCAYL